MNRTLKRMLIIFGFFIISIFFTQNKVFADNILLWEYKTNTITGSKDEALSNLSSWYDYNMSEIYSPLYLGYKNNGIEIYVEKSGDDYTVAIGDEKEETTSKRGSFSYDDLKTYFDLPDDYCDDQSTLDKAIEENGGVSWETILKVSVSKTTKYGYKVVLTFTIIEAGNDIETNYENSTIIDIGSVTEVIHDFLTDTADTLYSIVDGVADAYNWVKKFTSNPVGTIVNLILDGIMNIFGDGPQIMINYIQTSVDGTAKDRTLLYTVDELTDDANGATMYGQGQRDKYTHVSEEKELDGEYDVDIKDVDGDKNDDGEDDDGLGYKFEDNLIPITSVDIYTMATNKVSFLDVNFLTENTAGKNSSIWLSIRNIVTNIIRTSFYVAALILITSLIWYGVKIVANTMTPQQRADDQKGLNSFITSVTMLVGSIIIMAIGIYAYQAVGLDDSSTADTSDPDYWEFPIRVNVTITSKTWWENFTIKDQEYSFSTTITGYMRFMAQIENPDRCMEKAGYVIAYVILANMNVIIFVIMVFRMFAMWILSIVGPILAVLYAITKDEKMVGRYRTWAYCYLILGFIQLFFAIAYWIMAETMGFN